MIAGVRGRLLTASFIRDVFPTLPGVERAAAVVEQTSR